MASTAEVSSDQQLLFVQSPAWLATALFDSDRHRATAAEANLRRALRTAEGFDAAAIAISEFPILTRHTCPRLWAAYVRSIDERNPQFSGA